MKLFAKMVAAYQESINCPPKNTIGVMTNDGIIDICSKFLLTTPIKNPNNAKVKETNTNKNIINIGYITVTSAKKDAVA